MQRAEREMALIDEIRYYPALLLVVIRLEKELCERFGEESEPHCQQMPSFFPHL